MHLQYSGGELEGVVICSRLESIIAIPWALEDRLPKVQIKE